MIFQMFSACFHCLALTQNEKNPNTDTHTYDFRFLLRDISSHMCNTQISIFLHLNFAFLIHNLWNKWWIIWMRDIKETKRTVAVAAIFIKDRFVCLSGTSFTYILCLLLLNWNMATQFECTSSNSNAPMSNQIFNVMLCDVHVHVCL